MRKFVSIFFNALRTLSFKKIVVVFKIGICHPLFSILYFYASFRAFNIAKKLYPETSSTNGAGNAFRHSFWVCLIMMYFCKISSPEKSEKWCRKLTDLHEELFPNKPLETMMDKHNNDVGLQYFMSMLPGIHRQFFETSFFIKELQKKTENAVILESLDQTLDEHLVYLRE
ncbi:hypothetical protein [Soonwooa sp.]|uniref:DUF6973 domain-containing protein n=1 Tax=Soonwooa sp. TaxID=1938592 RepID=UPI00260579DF|nr:hypothetical protein [Soonwooa sp.]